MIIWLNHYHYYTDLLFVVLFKHIIMLWMRIVDVDVDPHLPYPQSQFLSSFTALVQAEQLASTQLARPQHLWLAYDWTSLCRKKVCGFPLHSQLLICFNNIQIRAYHRSKVAVFDGGHDVLSWIWGCHGVAYFETTHFFCPLVNPYWWWL